MGCLPPINWCRIFATTGWAHQLRTADLRKAASFTRTPRGFFSIIYMGSTWIHNISNSLINHLVGYTRYTPTIPTINHKFGICCLRTQHCLARHGMPWCLKWSNFKLIFSKPCPFLGRATISSCRANKRKSRWCAAIPHARAIHSNSRGFWMGVPKMRLQLWCLKMDTTMTQCTTNKCWPRLLAKLFCN